MCFLNFRNLALFILDENQRNIFDNEKPNFETEICSELCKNSKMKIKFFSEKEIKDQCQNSEGSLEKVINYFESNSTYQINI